MNQIIHFSQRRKLIKVQAGTRWCDIQRHIDQYDLAVKIMQTYANFTVGGSLSVNAHGRYVGLGPVVLSVRNIVLVLADGSKVHASPDQNREYFYAAIGGYGAIGVIAEVELDLADNVPVERTHKVMQTHGYLDWFRNNVRSGSGAVFHNADLYPPHYNRLRAVTWSTTTKTPTTRTRLQPLRKIYALEKYFLWSISEAPLGKLRRQMIIDPLLYLGRKIHWRNYEAGYDVAELEPIGRDLRTYVLQEYFIPCERIMDFIPKMEAIFRAHDANIINVSIRHAIADPGTLLAWARGETFAFVVYYKQRTHQSAVERVGAWTRELIQAAIDCGGTYYLPYQLHATREQFHSAYPRAKELFDLKKKLDPTYRLRSTLWDKYYMPELANNLPVSSELGLFQSVFGDEKAVHKFYLFLQNIFHLYPEDRLVALIKSACGRYGDDQYIYRTIQSELPTITPPLSLVRFALPALLKQKSEIGKQMAAALGPRALNGYVEIGSTGRYVGSLRKHLNLAGPATLVGDKAPGYSPPDLVERGGIKKVGRFLDLNNYSPLATEPSSADLVSCFIGLHHAPLEKLDGFLESIARTVRPGGIFALRDHDVKSKEMADFVGLAHCVFNAGLGESWATNAAELRHFRPIAEWIELVESFGFTASGSPILQEGDPTENMLVIFVRKGP
jgi:FAD/FMN-containing dehydrogenase